MTCSMLFFSIILLLQYGTPSVCAEKSHIRIGRQAMKNDLWPNATIPIFFAPNYPLKQRASVLAGIKAWESGTCVRFRIEDEESADRVQVINANACQSFVGRRGGVQALVLGPGCNGVSTSAHELGHVLGLQHTQSRADRDRNIYVDRNNLRSATYDLNFGIHEDSSTLGVPYDITSIMHYQPYDFAWNPQRPTIIPRPPWTEYSKCMGNYQPSFYDYATVNRMYGCDKKCLGVSTRCSNGGVPSVNDCSRCLCPAGWGGRLCEEMPLGTQTLKPTEEWQVLQVTIGKYKDDQLPEFAFRHLLIIAPLGYKVQLKVDYLWAGLSAGCKFGGIEVFTKNDTRITPPRACQTHEARQLYTSDQSRIYIRLYNRFSKLRVDFRYRYYH